MFDKKVNKIIVMLHENVMHYPPALNLIECLLNNRFRVYLISQGLEYLPTIITKNVLFSGYNVVTTDGKCVINRIRNRFSFENQFRRELIKQFNDDDIIWTINPRIIRTLGKTLRRYSKHHIMEIMELLGDFYPLYNGDKYIGFNIQEYAQNAWKVVVPERNRAYIQKVTWELPNMPIVLPNKPYYIDYGKVSKEMLDTEKRLKSETRKIIMYLGVFDPDRTFKEFAEAIDIVKKDYCFYFFGKCDDSNIDKMNDLCSRYDCFRYCGFFNPPSHLYFLKYAYMGLLPYYPVLSNNGVSVLNALYCAPNKIFEYAGYNVPMIGTDVLGLREPFEKYNIGVCCNSLEPNEILKAIDYVDKNHHIMSSNCKVYFDSFSLDEIIKDILN